MWRNLPSSTVARGYVLAHRILKTVIKHGGSNQFLRTEEFHSNVNRDFVDTDTGVKKKVNVVDAVDI